MKGAIVRPDTLAYMVKRAQESGIDRNLLGIGLQEGDKSQVDFAVIYGGALDEEFCANTDYEVNIADWIAEMLQAESNADADHESWVVLVTKENFGLGETVYRVASDPELA